MKCINRLTKEKNGDMIITICIGVTREEYEGIKKISDYPERVDLEDIFNQGRDKEVYAQLAALREIVFWGEAWLNRDEGPWRNMIMKSRYRRRKF